MILVVGAGVAGLTCAKVLVEAGQEVRVLEASDHVGGRVWTDHNAEGFLLDRGFQALFSAYPSARRHLDLETLKPRAFTPGAALIRDGKWHLLGDPWQQLSLLGPTLSNPLLTLGDKLRAARLRRYARRRSLDAIFTGHIRGGDKSTGDKSTYAELRRRHFKATGFIENFARPFWGGVFLDRELNTSTRMLFFTLKMLSSGKTVLPEQGIGAIALQLASKLPAKSLYLETRVEGIVEADGRAVGVTLTGGEEMQGDAIVIATDAETARRFVTVDLPVEAVPVTCVYFATTESLYSGPRLLLNADPDAFVNHAIQLSNVSPALAPKGQHLFSATVLGLPDLSDPDLVERCLTDIRSWFPGKDLATLRHLATYRVRFAQFRQSPGVFATLPANVTPTAGLILAGEYTESSSIQGAMASGEKAAQAALSSLASVDSPD